MDKINHESETIANSLLNMGYSERALAAFVGMHECVNHLADRIGGNKEIEEKFLISLQMSLFEIAKKLGVNKTKNSRENVAKHPDLLKEKLVAVLEEIIAKSTKIVR